MPDRQENSLAGPIQSEDGIRGRTLALSPVHRGPLERAFLRSPSRARRESKQYSFPIICIAALIALFCLPAIVRADPLAPHTPGTGLSPATRTAGSVTASEAPSDAPAPEGEPADRETRNAGTESEDAPRKDDATKKDTPAQDTPASDAPAKGDAETKADIVLAEGQVLDPLGSGCRGVTVSAVWKGEEKPFFEGTSEQYGDFKVLSSKRAKGTILVTFSYPGYAPETRESEVGVDEWPAYIDVQLKGTLTFTGKVLSHLDNVPIPNATIVLSLAFSKFEDESGADGSFEFSKLIPTRGEIVITAEGHGRESQPVEIKKDMGVQEFVLKPERLVRITAVDPTGKPVDQVVIEVLDQERQDFRTVMTDSEGRAELKQIHFDADYLKVRYSHPDYISSNDFGREFALPADKVESEHELILKQAGRVTGKVLTGALGDPVSGARVMTGEAADDRTPRAWSNYTGAYEITGVAPGEVILTTHARGYAPALHRLTVEAGKSHEVEIKLQKGATLRGTVIGHDKNPVAGAYIATGEWQGAATLGLRAESGADGRFSIEDMPPGEINLMVYGPRGGRIDETVTAGGEPVVLELPEFDPATADGAGPATGEAAPEFSAVTLDDASLALGDLTGKVVLLDFWATWCGPCVAEIPKLIKLHEKYGGREDFVMIGISLDQSRSALSTFIKQRKMGWQQVFGTTARKTADAYSVRGIPALFLIGRDGKILGSNLPGSAVEEAVRNALGD